MTRKLLCRLGWHDDELLKIESERASNLKEWANSGAYRVDTTTVCCKKCGRIKKTSEPWGHYY